MSNLTDSKIIKFYNIQKNKKILVDLIEKNNSISLRVIEYFITIYAKNKRLVINNNKFNIYTEYKNQLKQYSKKYFDPFRRNNESTERTILYENKKIKTTDGQCNFIKWCIENNILDYINKHLTEIKEEMKNPIIKKTDKKDKNNTMTKKSGTFTPLKKEEKSNKKLKN